MKVATVAWNLDDQAAHITLEGTEGEDVREGVRLLACMARDRPWRELPDDGRTEPERSLQFMIDCLHRLGYLVQLGAGCEPAVLQ